MFGSDQLMPSRVVEKRMPAINAKTRRANLLGQRTTRRAPLHKFSAVCRRGHYDTYTPTIPLIRIFTAGAIYTHG